MANEEKNDLFAVSLLQDKGDEIVKDKIFDGSNTTLFSRESYASNEKIQKYFQDKDGNFDEASFNTYYKGLASVYQNMVTESQKNKLNKDPELDTWFGKGTKFDLEGATIRKVKNPFEIKTGTTSYGKSEESDLTISELAQKGSYKNSDGVDYGHSLNVASFLQRIFKPAAIAQWDDDGYHIDSDSGKKVKHKKGEYKFDENGRFYTEDIGDKDPAGRQIIGFADTLTTDGSFANKFDFMDSDGKDKHIVGTVMKNAVKIIPYFIPGVGQVYTYAMVGVELTNLAATLAQVIPGAVVGDDIKDTEYYKSLNRVKSFKRGLFDSGVSEHSKENLFTFENIGNMAGDVVGQLQGQVAIAKLPRQIGASKVEANAVRLGEKRFGKKFTDLYDDVIKKNGDVNERLAMISKMDPALGKAVAKQTKALDNIGRWSSNIYMAGTSAEGVVDEAKLNGLNERETAALFLGTMGAYSWIMSQGVGEWALRRLGLDEAGAKVNGIIRTHAKEELNALGLASASKGATDPNKLQKLFNAGRKIGEKTVSKFKNLDSVTGAMGAEALEEVSEEALADSMKVLYNGFVALGLTAKENTSFGFSLDDMIGRYAMSAIGGGIGGGIHIAKDVAERGRPKNYKTMSSLEADKEMLSLIRSGESDNLLKKIDELESAGKFGSKELSIIEDHTDEDGGIVYKPIDSDESMSHNASIASILRQKVNLAKDIMFQEGIPDNEFLDGVYNKREGLFIDMKVNTSIREDLDSLTTDIIKTRAEIEQLKQEGGNQVEPKIKEKEQLLASLRDEVVKIKTGEKYEHYLGRALFNMNDVINSPFMPKSQEKISQQKFQKSYDSLNKEEKSAVDTEFKAYVEGDRRTDLIKGFEEFSKIQSTLLKNPAELFSYGESQHGFYQGKSKSEYTDSEGNLNELDKFTAQAGRLNPDTLQTVDLNTVPTLNLSDALMDYFVDENGIIEQSTEGKINAVRNFINGNQFVDKHTKEYLKDFVGNEKLNGEFVYKTIENKIIPLEGVLEREFEKLNLESPLQAPIYLIDKFLKENLTTGNVEKTKEEIAAFIKSKEYTQTISDSIEGVSKENKERIVNSLLTATEQAVEEGFDEVYNQKLDENGLTIGEITSSLSALNSEIENKDESPLYKVLRQFSMNNDGEADSGIIELLEAEMQKINTAAKTDPTSYVIDSNVTIDGINQGLELIEKVAAAIQASVEVEFDKGVKTGFNTAINNSRKESGLDNVPVMSERAADGMLKDLSVLMNRLNYIKRISALNQESKISNQVTAGLRHMALTTELFRRESEMRKSLEDAGFDLSEIDDILDNTPALDAIRNAIDPSAPSKVPVDPDTFANAELEATRIESAVYKLFQEQKLLDKDLHKKILGIFDRSILKSQSVTEFNSTTTTLKEYDKFIYLNTVLGSDSAKFKAELLGSDGNGVESLPYIPFSTQEFYSRIGYFLLESPRMFNETIKYLQKRNEGDDGYDEEYDGNNIHGILKNALVVLGSGGVGKTTGVLGTFNRILENRGLNVAVFGPGKAQGEIISKAFESAGNIINKDTINDKKAVLGLFLNENEINELEETQKLSFTENFREEYKKNNSDNEPILTEVKDRSGIYTFKINEEGALSKSLLKGVNSNGQLVINGKPVNAIIIDEATHFSSVELEIINKGVENHNKKNPSSPVFVIYSGDTNQKGFESNGSEFNLESFNYITGPYLSISMRTAYAINDSNGNSVQTVLNDIGDYFKNVLDYGQDNKREVKKMFEAGVYNNSLKFNTSEVLVGHMVVDSIDEGEVQKILDKIDGTNEKIGVITDDGNSQVIKDLKNKFQDNLDKFEFLTMKEVQGREFNFVIADVNNNVAIDGNVHAILSALKSLNTIIGRSRVGSMLTKKTVGKFPFESIRETDSPIETTLDKKKVEEYRETRLNSLLNISQEIPVELNITPSSTTIEETVDQNDSDTDENELIEETTEKIKEVAAVISEIEDMAKAGHTQESIESSQASKIDAIENSIEELKEKAGEDENASRLVEELEEKVTEAKSTMSSVKTDAEVDDAIEVLELSEKVIEAEDLISAIEKDIKDGLLSGEFEPKFSKRMSAISSLIESINRDDLGVLGTSYYDSLVELIKKAEDLITLADAEQIDPNRVKLVDDGIGELNSLLSIFASKSHDMSEPAADRVDRFASDLKTLRVSLKRVDELLENSYSNDTTKTLNEIKEKLIEINNAVINFQKKAIDEFEKQSDNNELNTNDINAVLGTLVSAGFNNDGKLDDYEQLDPLVNSGKRNDDRLINHSKFSRLGFYALDGKVLEIDETSDAATIAPFIIGKPFVKGGEYTSDELSKIKRALSVFKMAGLKYLQHVNESQKTKQKPMNFADFLKKFDTKNEFRGLTDEIKGVINNENKVKYGIITKRYDMDIDKSTNPRHNLVFDNAYNFPFIEVDFKDGRKITVTLGHIQHLKKANSNKNHEGLDVRQLAILEKREKALKDNNGRPVKTYFKNDKKNPAGTGIFKHFSNLRLKDTKGKQLTLAQFKEENPWLLVSEPMIFTGAGIFGNSISDVSEIFFKSTGRKNIFNLSLLGRPVVFVTESKNRYEKADSAAVANKMIERLGRQIEESILLRGRIASGEQVEVQLADDVKAIFLNVEGSNFKNWFKDQVSLLESIDPDEVDTTNQLKSNGNKFAAARILQSIIFHQFSLKRTLEMDNQGLKKSAIDDIRNRFSGLPFNGVSISKDSTDEEVLAYIESTNKFFTNFNGFINQILGLTGAELAEAKAGGIKAEELIKTIFDELTGETPEELISAHRKHLKEKIKFNHSYNVFLALKEAIMGGGTVLQSKGEKVAVTNSPYILNDQTREEVLSIIDRIMEPVFPDGIHIHPIRKKTSSATRSSEQKPFVLSGNSIDNYRVGVEVDGSMGLFDLSLLEDVNIDPEVDDSVALKKLEGNLNLKKELVINSAKTTLGSISNSSLFENAIRKAEEVFSKQNQLSLDSSVDMMAKEFESLVETFLNEELKGITSGDTISSIVFIGNVDLANKKTSKKEIGRGIEATIKNEGIDTTDLNFETSQDGSEIHFYSTVEGVNEKMITFRVGNDGTLTYEKAEKLPAVDPYVHIKENYENLQATLGSIGATDLSAFLNNKLTTGILTFSEIEAVEYATLLKGVYDALKVKGDIETMLSIIEMENKFINDLNCRS